MHPSDVKIRQLYRPSVNCAVLPGSQHQYCLSGGCGPLATTIGPERSTMARRPTGTGLAA